MEVRANNLYKSYRDKKVLENINFSINKPGVYLIAGPNGSGKTTFLEILVGLRKPNQGEVFINKVQPEKAKINREIGFLTQQKTKRKNCTVKEELTLVKELFQLDIDTYAYLKKFNLQEYYNIKTKKLSGGTKRRILIAMLLMPNHKVIVLDEPVSGLDTYSRDEIWNMVRDYAKDKIVITSDHYLNQASQYCDYTYLINQGNIVLHGETEHLISSFPYSYVIKTREQYADKLKEVLKADNDLVNVKVSGSVYNLFTNKDVIKSGGELVYSKEFSVHLVNLEDIYFYYTGAFVQEESI